MRKLSLAAAAASLAFLIPACSPPPEDDVEDVEELPDQDDLGEPDNNDLDNIDRQP